MEPIKENNGYFYSEIKEFLEDKKEFEEINYGKPESGEHFIVLNHKYLDQKVSFVLIGRRKEQDVYKCIFKGMVEQQ